ncbi:uncharacterized protein [Henckelia pumila]|uniref:uncharacterized protein n=1 Tax=Henckelia pumila TaxID=405737 RepID=UPI003C6DC382
MTQSLTTARKAVKKNCFQKHRINVLITGCFEFSSGLGQFLAKSSDIRSAMCSGEREGLVCDALSVDPLSRCCTGKGDQFSLDAILFHSVATHTSIVFHAA